MFLSFKSYIYNLDKVSSISCHGAVVTLEWTTTELPIELRFRTLQEAAAAFTKLQLGLTSGERLVNLGKDTT